MNHSDFSLVKLLIFVLFTMVIAAFSWRSLRRPQVHGFYRFFAFEGVLGLTMANGAWGQSRAPFWLEMFAQLLLAVAVVIAVVGYRALRQRGGNCQRSDAPANKSFENTKVLVTTGIYRYIRHPMYSGVLLWGWGVYLDDPHGVATLLILFTTLFTLLAARVEERENLAFFGAEYRAYMAQTRRFIPFLF